MKLFKKFIFLTVMPLVLFAITSVVITRSLDDLKSSFVNLMVTGFFVITNFIFVYVYENKLAKKYSVSKSITISALLVSSLIFIFSQLTIALFDGGAHTKDSIFQAILFIGIFLFEVALLKVYKKNTEGVSIEFKEKPIVYLKLMGGLFLFLTVFLILIFDIPLWEDLTLAYFDSFLLVVFYAFLNVALCFFMLYSLSKIESINKNVILISILSVFFQVSINAVLLHFVFRTFYIATFQSFLISLFLNCSVIALVLYRKNIFEKELQIKKLTFSNSQKEAEYLELKNQINPHFLFNNLNTLISFIEMNPKKAIEFGHHLSNVYRHYLKKQEDDFVSLNEELDFIDEYLAIYKAKFEKGINYTIIKDASNKLYLVSNCLQELIDNIFKHNVSDNENILEIAIKVQGNSMIVSNSVVKNNNAIANGFGLENIRKRHLHLTENEVKIKEDSGFFSVELPLFKME